MNAEPVERFEFPVPDAQIAIRLASAFMSKGYTIFRGQGADWKLTPTLHRPETDKPSASERFRLFADWIHRQPELRELHGNYDAVIAVAQHYGFKTPFLDFTRDPAVAAFFALEAGRTSEGRKSGSAVIACVNPEHAKEAWKPYNQRSLEQGQKPLLRLVDIYVQNLWRLKAQSGLFLDIHVDDALFRDITPIIFIIFPISDQPVGTPFPEIYPTNRSPLEAVLEQFFAEERTRPQIDQNARKLIDSGADPTAIWEAANARLRKFFVGASFPPDVPSWNAIDCSPWLISTRADLDEDFGYPEIEIRIDPEQTASRIWQVAHANILSQIDRWCSRGIVTWRATRPTTVSVDGQTSINEAYRTDKQKINAALSHMYDGMRWLPYTDEQIAQALSSYLCLVTRRAEFEKQWGRLVAIDLAAGLVTSHCLVGQLPCVRRFDRTRNYI